MIGGGILINPILTLALRRIVEETIALTIQQQIQDADVANIPGSTTINHNLGVTPDTLAEANAQLLLDLAQDLDLDDNARCLLSLNIQILQQLLLANACVGFEDINLDTDHQIVCTPAVQANASILLGYALGIDTAEDITFGVSIGVGTSLGLDEANNVICDDDLPISQASGIINPTQAIAFPELEEDIGLDIDIINTLIVCPPATPLFLAEMIDVVDNTGVGNTIQLDHALDIEELNQLLALGTSVLFGAFAFNVEGQEFEFPAIGLAIAQQLLYDVDCIGTEVIGFDIECDLQIVAGFEIDEDIDLAAALGINQLTEAIGQAELLLALVQALNFDEKAEFQAGLDLTHLQGANLQTQALGNALMQINAGHDLDFENNVLVQNMIDLAHALGILFEDVRGTAVTIGVGGTHGLGTVGAAGISGSVTMDTNSSLLNITQAIGNADLQFDFLKGLAFNSDVTIEDSITLDLQLDINVEEICRANLIIDLDNILTIDQDTDAIAGATLELDAVLDLDFISEATTCEIIQLIIEQALNLDVQSTNDGVILERIELVGTFRPIIELIATLDDGQLAALMQPVIELKGKFIPSIELTAQLGEGIVLEALADTE